ncbi:MAG: SDR family oxidoreductase [Burkholderiales bacterium]|nr:SDR family oxidoreductase [Anaerolineae bacterium]
MKRTLITGAGRGLGLEFARQCLQRGDTVFATVRAPADAPALVDLQAAYGDKLTIVPLDVADKDSIEASYQRVREHTDRLDLLVNNAGIGAISKNVGDVNAYRVLGQLDDERLLFMLRVNAVAPLMIAQRYLDLLQASDAPRVVSISSGRGSLHDKTTGGSYGYSTSKAALNMFMRSFAFDVLEFGIINVVINPGWVQTDMGGSDAELMPEESIAGILRVVDSLTPADAGRFLDWQGNEHPW